MAELNGSYHLNSDMLQENYYDYIRSNKRKLLIKVTFLNTHLLKLPHPQYK